MYKIAVDIGGTNIKVAVINDDLEMIDYKRLKRQTISIFVSWMKHIN